MKCFWRLTLTLGTRVCFLVVAGLEERVVQMLSGLLGCANASGYVSIGGTESNIPAIRAARNQAGKKDANIVVPASDHFSFDKIGDMLCSEVRKAELDENLKVDIESVESLIDDKTVALVGIAGTTEFGQVYPIEDIAKIAEGSPNSHACGCSFLRVTIDPHKMEMGMSAIPAGGLLFSFVAKTA